MKSLLSKALFRVRKKRVVRNALGNERSQGAPRALVYYKTDPLFSSDLRNSYRHTNDNEVLEIVRLLRKLGFNVDLVDREAAWSEVAPLLNEKYAIYFANAAGNSARLHTAINHKIDALCRIYYAAGPEPEYSNELVHKRHNEFDARTGKTSVRRRILRDANYEQRLHGMDAIFYVGNEFSASTFRRVSTIPLFRVFPSTSPAIYLDLESIKSKSSSSFLYLGGNGLICKGLDLVLEAFDGLTDLSLDVCGPGPNSESDFWNYYQPLLQRNPQIRFHGFVDVTGSHFREISSHAAYNVFPSCSEGCATSVVTAMRRGVIPVITRESGVDIGEFGFQIEDISVNAIRNLAIQLARLPREQLTQRVIATYLDSNRYSMDGFRSSMTAAFLQTLSQKKLI